MTDTTTPAQTEAKDATATDASSGPASETSSSDAPKGYSRGENQKLVTDAYRQNWDRIFGQKDGSSSKA
ncbi:MAG: hypothetical protein H6905_00900 [Hyphomicrobiales bacterium]|nr:hypothetical protein [Hyphomicrobiales bacterium]